MLRRVVIVLIVATGLAGCSGHLPPNASGHPPFYVHTFKLVNGNGPGLDAPPP